MQRNIIIPRAAIAAAGIATAAVAYAMPGFGPWSTPIHLEALPGSANNLNTPAVDGCASMSADGLDIAFTSNRSGNFDIYMAHRESMADGFGPASALPAPVNGPTTDACPTLLRGKRLMYTSARDDPAGDLYVTRLGPDGWSAPERLGPNINLPGVQDEVGAVYEDAQGREVLIWTRRPGDNTTGKLYYSINGSPAALLQGGPHSSAGDNRASVTHDGKTIFWDSTRIGGIPRIFMATRSSTSQPFGTAVEVTELNAVGLNLRPFVSWDGTMITLSSNRTGSESAAPDMWYATRDKQVGN